MINLNQNITIPSVENMAEFYRNISEVKLFDYRILFFTIAAYVLIKYKLSLKWCRSPTCLVGKTVVITGANTGIGFAAALDFAKRGARVILACRNDQKGTEACKEIQNLTGNKEVYFKLLNLGSFDSVKRFAKDVAITEDKIDVLVNNAAMPVAHPKNLTEDGYHVVKQVNYLSPFLLTMLLMDLLKKSKKARVINVSSFLAMFGKINLNHMMNPSHPFTYIESKLCNILFTVELAKRCANDNVTVYSVEPGAVRTQIFRKLKGIMKIIFVLTRFYYKTPEEGAQTIIYLGVEKNLEKYSGEHFSNCTRARRYTSASKKDLSGKVWKATEDLLKDHLPK